MAADAAGLIARFPEFEEVYSLTPATINSAIADAKNLVSKAQWGVRYEMGVLWCAASLLAMTPLGEHARLKMNDQASSYGVTFERMKKALPVRCLVTGGL